MTFVRGDAMELLFWTIALTSFSPVLHFTIFPFRATEDKIERLRVPSHMRNLSREEMLALYQTHDLPVECCEAVKPAVLQKWLDHTQTPQEVQMDIVRQMEREITGGEKTGFSPYYRDGKIQFDH